MFLPNSLLFYVFIFIHLDALVMYFVLTSMISSGHKFLRLIGSCMRKYYPYLIQICIFSMFIISPPGNGRREERYWSSSFEPGFLGRSCQGCFVFLAEQAARIFSSSV